jgi:hypothetical protein
MFLYGGLNVGDNVLFSQWSRGWFTTFDQESDLIISFLDVYSDFTVLSSDVSIVVQPLPSSLMLLPAGLGALAFLRHRRRKTA